MSENRCCCKKNLLDNDLEQVEKIKKIIDKYKGKNGALIPALHEAQDA